jgi:hypothetical protein
MSMHMSLLMFPDALAEKMVSEEGLAERVVEQPEAFEIGFEHRAQFNYRDFDRIQAGRPWLTKALDQEHGTQVGDDFGYGPGRLFTSKEVVLLVNGLVAEAKESEGKLDDDFREQLADFADFFAFAAEAKKSVLLTVS